MRGHDGEARPVRDVRVGRDLMLNPVAGPGGAGTADREYAAAAEGARHHELGSRLVVVGTADRLGRVFDHGAQHRLAHAVGELVPFLHEILLERV